ncbi:MAG: hypothetical protein IPM16_23505 [Chloroflexi bacterium]|nr:hypothetical protein [Chloroflexota bacterium]
MDDASKLLILGGVLNIAFGLVNGIPIALQRQSQPDYSKYLRLIHVGALMWGPILISLVLALQLSPLDAGIELVAAGLMVAASILLNVKDTLNWRMGVKDEFAEKPRIPQVMGGLFFLTSLVSIAIITLGVVQGVFST